MSCATAVVLAVSCIIPFVPTARAAPQFLEGDIPPGAAFDYDLTLSPTQFTSIEIDRQHADVKVTVRADGQTVRELVSVAYSVASIRLGLLGKCGASWRISLSVAKSGGAAHYRLAIAPPREASDRDRRQWEAEGNLLAPAPPKLAAAERIVHLREAASFFAESGDTYKQASCLRLLGILYMDRQEFPAAREQFARALAILKQSPWRFEESVIHQNLAAAMDEMSEGRAAIVEFDAVLAIRAELRDEFGRGITLYARAKSFLNLGELQDALDDLRASLAVFRKLNESRWQATVLNALGLLQVELGDIQAARSSYAEATSVWNRLKDQNGLMMTTNNLGMLNETLGDHTSARSDFEEARRLALALGNRQAHAYILQNLGDVAANQGDHTQALADYQESLTLKTELGDTRAAAESRRKMGLSYLALGKLQQARLVLNEALAESRSVNNRTGEAQSLAALARLERAAGALPVARRRMGEAATLIESTRMELRTRDLRTSYFSTYRDFYDFAMDLALAAGASGAADGFTWSERARARSLLDAVQRAGTAKDESLPQVVSARSARELLDPGTVLVEYSVNAERTIAFVVSAARVSAVLLPGSTSLNGALAGLGPSDVALNTVARLVWWPLKIPMRTARVIIVADGGLERVPFAALPAMEGGPRLVEHSQIVSAPSASLVAAIRRNQPAYPRRIAVFADPIFSTADLRAGGHSSETASPEFARLRFSREEAADITAKAGASLTSAWLDSDASSANFRRAAMDPGAILHLATHAVVEGPHPDAARLIFSGGNLPIGEIYNLRIRRQLVVLSSCDTAAGPWLKGEGILSLTRAFLYAGAKGVVASLWKVDDRGSAEFMRRFYQGLVSEHRTPADALRIAQLAMLHDPRWSAVENWAPFLFAGDWRISPWGPPREP
ncbi:MAG TPA: CHAT domain-containing tetratricopeptide repeat protein [Candidatus Sulfopaludibacter sp.]|jgi:tetratricopeptide (TPR) repeat protein|nr:CHAT domain-containing tetratricopeptide repeat protein [Candidatus Sulfopaludibacter sp.]